MGLLHQEDEATCDSWRRVFLSAALNAFSCAVTVFSCLFSCFFFSSYHRRALACAESAKSTSTYKTGKVMDKILISREDKEKIEASDTPYLQGESSHHHPFHQDCCSAVMSCNSSQAEACQ